MHQRTIDWTISKKSSLWQGQIRTVRKFRTVGARVPISTGAHVAVAVSGAGKGVATTVPVAVAIVIAYASAPLLPWQTQLCKAVFVQTICTVPDTRL